MMLLEGNIRMPYG